MAKRAGFQPSSYGFVDVMIASGVSVVVLDVEIKKMVVEMIISRIIHCNNNSYSSSVISIKKNNGS
ncbi:hypothetical protein WN944_026953 [Citrus x changshan-huyou]|uniref:Uncharacterized protein n=1 Tax=Citrus x changshan-huyou TaxID=2935761 RepID=A0AAP0Q9E7_9ROSI